MKKTVLHDRLAITYHLVIDQLAQAIASPQTAKEALLEASRAVAIEQTKARILNQPSMELDLLEQKITSLKARIYE